MAAKLKTLYQETIVPKLMDQFQYSNIHQVPKLMKVTINRGLGEAAQNAKSLEASLNEIATITGHFANSIEQNNLNICYFEITRGR